MVNEHCDAEGCPCLGLLSCRDLHCRTEMAVSDYRPIWEIWALSWFPPKVGDERIVGVISHVTRAACPGSSRTDYAAEGGP
jgi:hypothetical protein